MVLFDIGNIITAQHNIVSLFKTLTICCGILFGFGERGDIMGILGKLSYRLL